MSLAITKYKILIQRYKNRIFGYALYMLKNKMDAEDVTQEVFIRIWNNLNSFKVRSASSYIMKITHNLCLDYLRRNKSISSKTIYIDHEFLEIRDDQLNSNPTGKVHVKIMSEKIKHKIQQLPENIRAPFVLYEVHGMKYKEISSILEIPLNTVKVNILRARKKLQEELKVYEKHDVI